MSSIAFVGHAVWDHVFKVPCLTAEPGKWVAQSYDCRPGGMAANAALAAQRLRLPQSPEVRLLAPMGDDDIGRQLAAALAAAGVTVQPEVVMPGARTSVSVVLVDDEGERQGHNVRGSAQALSPLPQPDWLAGVLAIQVDPRWPAGALRALQLARQLGIVSLLDGEVAATDTLRDLAPLADWVVFSSDGLRAWGAQPQAHVERLFDQVCAELPHTQLAVTLGPHGLRWRPPGERVQSWPAYPVTVVNTNGAGDALHGSLLLALAEGASAETALRIGMAAGALTCAARPFGRAEVQALIGKTPTAAAAERAATTVR